MRHTHNTFLFHSVTVAVNAGSSEAGKLMKPLTVTSVHTGEDGASAVALTRSSRRQMRNFNAPGCVRVLDSVTIK